MPFSISPTAFSRSLTNDIHTFFSEVDEYYRKRIENRKKKDGAYFQYAMNCPSYPQLGFNLWYMVGESFPMAMDEMVMETLLLLALWNRYTEKGRFFGFSFYCVR